MQLSLCGTLYLILKHDEIVQTFLSLSNIDGIKMGVVAVIVDLGEVAHLLVDNVRHIAVRSSR